MALKIHVDSPKVKYEAEHIEAEYEYQITRVTKTEVNGSKYTVSLRFSMILLCNHLSFEFFHKKIKILDKFRTFCHVMSTNVNFSLQLSIDHFSSNLQTILSKFVTIQRILPTKF